MKQLNDFLFYVIILILLNFVTCLYEDQIGKFDWRHQFIGRVDNVLRASDIWQDHQLLITSTHSGSLAGLYLRNGSINWRHILENFPINFLGSWPKSNTEFSCPVLSINNNGRWIRCWKTNGILLSEHFLPNDFLNEIDEKDSSNTGLLFEINKDLQNPILLIVKISYSNYLIEFFHYHFRTKKFETIQTKITTGKWLDKSSCHLITWEYLICIDQKNREFQMFDLNGATSINNNNNRQFKRIPLTTFGLTNNADSNKTTSNNNDDPENLLKIQLLPDISTSIDKTLTISKSSSTQQQQLQQNVKYFSLNLGQSQGLVLFKILPGELQDSSINPSGGSSSSSSTGNSGGGASIRLVKIFPYAIRMTILPLISSTGPEPSGDDSSIEKLDYGVAVLFTKKESIPYEDESDAIHQQKVFAIKLAIFHMESWQEVQSISSKSILFEFGSKQSIAPISSNGKLVKRLDDQWFIDQFEILPIRSHIYNQNRGGGRDQNRYTYKMLLTTIDGTMILTNLMGKINWAREEALAEINSLVVLDLPLSDSYSTLEQEYGFDEKNSNIISMFLNRIKSQSIQLINYLIKIKQWLLNSFNSLNKRNNRRQQQDDESDEQQKINENSEELMDSYNNNNNDNNDDDDQEILIRDYFGFHKLIIVRTKIGKLFALDTITGRIIWSKYEPSLSVKSDLIKFPIWVQRSTAHYPYSAICTILNDNFLGKPQQTFLYSFDPIKGIRLDSKWLPFKTLQAMLVQSIYDEEFRRPLLLLDSNYKAYLYPDNFETRKLFSEVSKKYYMMIVNQTSAMISGLSFQQTSKEEGPKSNLIWNYRLPYDSNKLISIKTVFKRPHERVHSQGRVLGDRNVLYKYLNPNLVVVLCESLDSQEKSMITLYLIDSITGNIIYSIVHRRARGPSQIVHSENMIIYSYYNDKMRRNEISSIELYEGFNQINSTAFSSIGRDLMAIPIVEQKAFIFPTGIGIMTDTETLKGITSKHILISLPTGGILELPRAFLDPRRPIKPTQEHAEEGLIPYVPELPIPSETIINYNQTVFSVRGIVTTPASLESTSLVCVYGLDFYYTRVAPSKTFDILKDDFDHLLIMAVLSLLIFMSYLVKYLASKKSLNAAWK